MTVDLVIVFGFASLIFLCTVLLVGAVMMRSQWDKLAKSHLQNRALEPERRPWWDRASGR